jgi:hypothetical protein
VAVEMAMWRMTEAGPIRLETTPLDLEARLEDMLVEDPSLMGLDVLLIGRQITTGHGGYIDVLAVDVEGQLVVVELKRDKTPRDIVAQLLDYGSWVQTLTLADVRETFAEKNSGDSFDDAFAERFGAPVPDAFNADHQLTIVASALDPASERIVGYLAERHGVPINAVFFRHFIDAGSSYLARTWLIDPVEVEAKPKSAKKIRPWNGHDFYVTLGRFDHHNRWDVARKYGFVSAGGGAQWWKPLRNLSVGHRVFAYVGGAGYVGVGEVKGAMQPMKDFVADADGVPTKLIDQPDLPEFLRTYAEHADPEQWEYVVPVEWIAAVPTEQAFSLTGLFAVPNSACRLKDERTIAEVSAAFGLAD